MRELAVFTMRSRMRSLVFTGRSRMSWLLRVMYWPSRPAIMASWKLPKLGWIVPSFISRQSSTTMTKSRSTLGGSGSSTISTP